MKEFCKTKEVECFDLEKLGLGDMLRVTYGKNILVGTIEHINDFFISFSFLDPVSGKREPVELWCFDANISIEMIQKNDIQLEDVKRV